MNRTLGLVFGVTGVVFPFAGSTAPAGWLLCDGSAVSRATYATLFGVIGTTYGAGDGSTTFNLPDLRGRVVAGRDDMGGVAAGRITDAGNGNPGISGATLGATGGVDRHTITDAQLPTGVPVSLGSLTVYGSGSNSAVSTATYGSGHAHPNVQPTMVMNHIIRT